MRQKRKPTNELDLGLRRVGTMNFSKVVTLPKTFTDNYLSKTRTVRVTMLPDGRLTLTPVHTNDKEVKG